MLIDVDDNFFNELEEVSTLLDMTVGEYLENLHEKNQSLKNVLLEDKEGLQEFVKKYHTVLDDLFILNREALAIVNENDDAEIMKPVFLKLSKIASGDITVLSKLYDVYVQTSKQQMISSSTLE
ncbi:MAG: hypothetical protein ABS916_06820 [Carnobacterium sp.]|uniref:Uncharacterized protein n=1 Tax=Carnobacterium viridans TaxID=174587 RepID=A0A1H1AUD5_9LACT|nr:hypothetical protein [Carnobacterium viridans]UDE96070.1 hypothetical protein LHA31_04935 [Carnobacterium viridans]SDQ42746.1 hypothetical protein SAMN04487752_2240 [Carnobacterium viridans]